MTVDAAVLRRLRRASPRSIIGCSGAALFVAAASVSLTGSKRSGLWVLAIVALDVARLLIVLLPPASADPRVVQRRYMAVIGCLALAWGTSPFWLAWPPGPGSIATALLAAASLIGVHVLQRPVLEVHEHGNRIWLLAGHLTMVMLLVAAGPLELRWCAFGMALLAIGIAMSDRYNQIAANATLNARTENAKLVERLREQAGLADKSNRDKTRFLAAAAHDLRQPLHALGLFGAAIEKRLRGRPEYPLINSMMRSIEALEKSFTALLDISRLDAGAVRPTFQVFPVRDLFRRIYMQYAGEAERQDISLRFRAAGKLVRSDPMLLERIVSNLVQNALRYTERGGVLVAARRCGNDVAIEVWDSGIGIPEDQIESIFHEFYQVDNSERDRTKGIGMGLAIVQRLAALLEHKLEVRSQRGRGTIFRVVIPASLEGMPDTAQLGADTLPPRIERALTVLLIDDEESIRRGMEEMFAPTQIHLIAAASLDEAEQLVEHGAIGVDFVISDLRLRGGENGVDVITAMRRLYGPALPAVLITGETSGDALQRANANGIVVLFKPVQPKEILRLINRLPA
ncbi:hypothetical protein BH10PSE17_BH10PSE17_01860 [soil metagenome]